MREAEKQFEAMRERQGSLSPGSTTSKTQVREPKNVLTALQQVFGTSYSYEFTRPIVHHPDDPGSPLPSDDELEERNANDSKGSRHSSDSHNLHRRSKSRSKSRQKPRLSSMDISNQYDNLRLSRSSEDPTTDQKRRSRSRRRTRKTQYYRSKSPVTPKLIARHNLIKGEAFDERDTAANAAAAAGIPSIIHTRVDGMCKTNAILLPHRKGGLQCLPMEVQPLPKMDSPHTRRVYAPKPQTKVPPYIGFSRSNDDAMYGI